MENHKEKVVDEHSPRKDLASGILNEPDARQRKDTTTGQRSDGDSVGILMVRASENDLYCDSLVDILFKLSYFIYLVGLGHNA